MSQSLTITKEVHFRPGRGSRKLLVEGPRPTAAEPIGRVPRVARLMALAIRLDRLLQAGELADYADIARLSHVTRARVTQIMTLLSLAPDIQERLLFLPRTRTGRDPIKEKMVRAIATVLDWRKQRRLWQTMHHGAVKTQKVEERSGKETIGPDCTRPPLRASGASTRAT